jgi:hypothetical protein
MTRHWAIGNRLWESGGCVNGAMGKGADSSEFGVKKEFTSKTKFKAVTLSPTTHYLSPAFVDFSHCP